MSGRGGIRHVAPSPAFPLREVDLEGTERRQEKTKRKKGEESKNTNQPPNKAGKTCNKNITDRRFSNCIRCVVVVCRRVAAAARVAVGSLAAANVSLCGLLAGRCGLGAGTETHWTDAL